MHWSLFSAVIATVTIEDRVVGGDGTNAGQTGHHWSVLRRIATSAAVLSPEIPGPYLMAVTKTTIYPIPLNLLQNIVVHFQKVKGGYPSENSTVKS